MAKEIKEFYQNIFIFLKNQIEKGKTNWESRSELIRASGENINGHTNRIVKEFEQKFRFGSAIDQKNKLRFFSGVSSVNPHP